MLTTLPATIHFSAEYLAALRAQGATALIPGDVMRRNDARRREYLASLGIAPDAQGAGFTVAPDSLVTVRHVRTLGAKVRKGEKVSDRDAAGATDSRCPALAAQGYSAEEIYSSGVRNTLAIRQASIPCPACLGALFARDAAGDADGAGEYVAEAQAIRDAAGRLKVGA